MIMIFMKYETNYLDGISYDLIKAAASSLRRTIKNFDENNRCPN
jgi:hypothetical protein